jgi:hypothetical protein
MSEKIAHLPDLVFEVQNGLNSMVRAEISYQGYRSAYNRKVAETGTIRDLSSILG